MTMHAKQHAFARLALLAACALLISACGKSMVRGEAPYVKIHSINLGESSMVIRLGVRNINDEPIRMAHVRFTVRLEQSELGGFEGPMDASVIATGSETLRFELQPSEAGRALLESLQNKEVPNLAYQLDGEIETAGDGTLAFSGDGRLYTVPGRPGQFR
jgi:LEA14-like dessication related protein